MEDQIIKNRNNLYYRIKARREELGLTREELAQVSDVSERTIKRIEGIKEWVSLEQIMKLAHALKMDIYVTNR